ncbi:MAG: gliding motility-associated C-terminal domain-containing protein, partial [Flavobacteriaceae bacterium]|nr:gliding motility-associated C-terminal domain-containing protein [Flavobacteriaceae bacterium]
IGNNGCQGDEFTVTVTVDPEPVVSDQFLTVCSEGASGIDFNGSTTIAAATYNITNIELNGLTVFAGSPAVGNGLTAADLADDAFTNTTNTPVDVVYTVVPVSAGGCQGDSFFVTITVEPEPVIADKIAVLICSGQTFKVEPMQGVDGNNVPAGTTYTWTVVDNPNVDGESDEILISQSEISQTLVNTTNNIEEVIYTVVPVTSNGCQGESFIISVTVNPEIQDNATVTNILCSYSDPLCAGSIEINPVGAGPFSFYWSSSNGNVSRPENQNQYNLCPGDYSLQITDSSGCIQYFEYTITPPEPLEVNLISLVDMSCNNIGLNCDGYIELDIKGGSSPYILKEFYTEKIPGSGQFDLLVESDSNILNNACKGNYVFKVIDNNGCELISPIYTIKETASPINVTEEISNYNGYEISCSGTSDGFINVSLSGGSGSFSYNLSPGMILDNDLSTPNILEFDNLKAGKYTLTITDNNCPNNIILEYDLKEPSELTSSSNLISDPINCFGGKEVYKVSASGGTAPYRGTGNYTLTAGIHSIKITDANGCETTETITVTEPNELTATAIVTDPILCNGEMGEVTITASGGTPPYKGTGVFNVKSGDFIFTVTDANGCTYSNNIFVNEPTELSFTIDSIENPTCSPDWSYSNGSICITITGGTNPSPIGSGWTSLGGGVWCLNGLSAGTYKVDVDDVNNCSTNTDIKEVVLTRPPVINAQITSTVTEDCDNNTMIQTNYLFINGGSPPYEITWSGGNICNPSNPQCMETTESGTYIAYIHDQESLTHGCPPIEIEVIVDLPEIGDANFSYSSTNTNFCDILSFNELITFNNESTGDIVNFYWDFGDGSPTVSNIMNPTHLYKTAGSYTVSLTVEYESNCCKETYSEVINVTKGYELETPNSFTPNKDGINDTIRPLFSCMQNVKMYIYDTLGTLVYFEEGSDLKGWDGYIKNIPAENGNYLMFVNALTFNGQEIKKHTPILLIR